MKIIISAISIILFSSFAYGAPFLVSDPYGPCGDSGQPACPVKAEIFVDGVSVAADVPLEADMSIKYDLSSMPTNEHTYTAKYYDEIGRDSVLSDPYLLLTTPTQPQGLNVVP